MKCPKCYREIEKKYLFCKYCGVKVEKNKDRHPFWITLLILCITVWGVSLSIIIAEVYSSVKSAGEYVDLGLSSGTLWKNVNEPPGSYGRQAISLPKIIWIVLIGSEDFYGYDEAVALFGDKLPTKEQWEELKDECTWFWTGNGYEVTGKNGNFITLPATGEYDYDYEKTHNVGYSGNYWSYTPEDSNRVWSLDFNSNSVGMFQSARINYISVRLVQD